MQYSLQQKTVNWLLAGLLIIGFLGLESCSKDDDDNPDKQEENNNSNNDDNETNPGDPDNHSASKGTYDLAIKGEYSREFEGDAFVQDSAFIGANEYYEPEDASAIFELMLEGDTSKVVISVVRHQSNDLQGTYQISNDITNSFEDDNVPTGASIGVEIHSDAVGLASKQTGSIEITNFSKDYIQGTIKGVKLEGASPNIGELDCWLNGEFYAKQRE